MYTCADKNLVNAAIYFAWSDQAEIQNLNQKLQHLVREKEMLEKHLLQEKNIVEDRLLQEKDVLQQRLFDVEKQRKKAIPYNFFIEGLQLVFLHPIWMYYVSRNSYFDICEVFLPSFDMY